MLTTSTWKIHMATFMVLARTGSGYFTVTMQQKSWDT
jgi:hypothetical protein